MSSDTSFSSSIALGVMRATSYMYKPIVSEEIIKQFGRILATIVGYEWLQYYMSVKDTLKIVYHIARGSSR